MAKVPITPKVLEWAIQESGFPPEDVAAHVEVDESALREWLRGVTQPTTTQFHKLARLLKRPEAMFFLPRPPDAAPIKVQFRFPPGVARREQSPNERLAVREAARLQRGLAWVMEALGENGPEFPIAAVTSKPDDVASMIRERLGVSVAAQLAWSNEFKARDAWRAALENFGVHVLSLPMGETSVQGFSLWHDLVPVIAVNTTRRSATARIYTLFHEFAHLLTRTSSLCAKGTSQPLAGGDQVERWCEQFAAALLLPWPDVERRLSSRFGWAPGVQIGDLAVPQFIATQFKVSLRAATIRLITRGVSSWDLYGEIPSFSDDSAGGGRPAEEGQGRRPEVRLRQYGFRTARTFLRGVRREAISRDDALRYLDVADSDLDELAGLTG